MKNGAKSVEPRASAHLGLRRRLHEGSLGPTIWGEWEVEGPICLSDQILVSDNLIR